MTVQVRLFARYAELFGSAVVAVDVAAPATVGALLERLRAMQPAGGRLPAKPLVAVNLNHARLTDPVSPGDEVALLPPLSGG